MAPLRIKSFLMCIIYGNIEVGKKVKTKLPHHTQNTLPDWEIQPVQNTK